MSHEVYICYDDSDEMTANAICHVLEENKIKCWLKSRDLGVDHIVDGVMEAINQSKVMILIFSSHSKNSNFVNTEVDIAFTEEIPILVFKIDESKLDGGLEFFLSNKHWLDAYPNPEVKFENLISDTSKLLEKPINKPIVDESKIKDIGNQSQRNHPNTIEKVEDRIDSDHASKNTSEDVGGVDSIKNISKSTNSNEVVKSVKKEPKFNKTKDANAKNTNAPFSKKVKISIIGIVLIVLVIGTFAFMASNSNNNSSDVQSDIKVKITNFKVVDDSKGGISGMYSYNVEGSISPMPDDAKNYKITSDFYDSGGNLVNSTEISLDKIQKSGKNLLLGSTVSDSKNIVRVEVKLMDNKNIIISQVESQL